MNNLTRSQFQSHPFLPLILVSGFSTAAVLSSSESLDCLNNLLKIHLDNPALLLSLVLTKHAITALDTLALMLDSLPVDSVLIDFILQKFAEPIKVFASISEGKLITTQQYIVHSAHSVNHEIKQLWQCGGVYVFTHLDSGLQYIGSAINFSRRIAYHLLQFGEYAPSASFHQTVKGLGGISSIVWSPVYGTTNFLLEFQQTNPSYTLSLGEYQILEAFSQFLPRVLEGSLLSELNPGLNSGSLSVYFNHVHFDPASLLNFSDSLAGANAFPVSICDAVTGKQLHLAASIVSAAAFLGISRVTVKAHLGKSKGLFSALFNTVVTVNKLGQQLVSAPVIHRLPHNWAPLVLVNVLLDELIGKTIYVYMSDRATLYATYSSYSKAFLGLNPLKGTGMTAKQAEVSSRSLQRACNWDKLVSTESGDFYIARNPKYVTRNKNT
ncbi:hypothetical protein EAH88_19125 [Rhodanobacter glycinis]|uniref:GIY-YIG domain-containing protein n=1 Tax=Rhodanobacter glycinis TaxID=582702 RepID=A0A502BW05_9GAMM|nr:GIY-YIG nuclease family protein [Rhodanobacter glycinis]TPG03871.1 hypothetical protein EAH88_19125 [Rhodanobacter glycinis]